MRINEIIDKQDVNEDLLNEGFWDSVKKAVVGGLISLSALGVSGLEAKEIQNMSPAEIQNELQDRLSPSEYQKFVGGVLSDLRKVNWGDNKVKAEPVKKAKVEPVKKAQVKWEKPSQEFVDKIANVLELRVKRWMRDLGYDTNMFGHRVGKSLLSDRIEGVPKGNGYWHFQIEVENKYGGDERVPVIVGFGNYKINALKIDGISYNNQVKDLNVDIRVMPQ